MPATEPFLGQIMAVAFPYAPRGWASCNGQSIPIAQNTALYALLGTVYGGDGRTSFALPNLNGRVAVGQGQGPGLGGYQSGQTGGDEKVALTIAQMPPHTHGASGVAAPGQTGSSAGAVWAEARSGRAPVRGYAASATGVLAAGAIASAGGGGVHQNMPPFLVMNYIIALQGVFPQRP